MKVKVCGMSNAYQNEEILKSEQIDFLGTIQFNGSVRFSPEKLKTSIPAIGVFVNASLEEICSKVATFGLRGVQLHGTETPELCKSLPSHLMIIKAIGITNKSDFEITHTFEGLVDYFLFDTATPNHGGSGTKFKWELLEDYRGNTPFFLSGGIDPKDVKSLKKIDHNQFAGVDINSRFEIAPTIKDANQVLNFIQELRS